MLALQDLWFVYFNTAELCTSQCVTAYAKHWAPYIDIPIPIDTPDDVTYDITL